MIQQNISIVNFPTLYNILKEIKSNLPFNIFDYSDEESFLKHIDDNKIDIKKSIFLVKEKSSFLYKNLRQSGPRAQAMAWPQSATCGMGKPRAVR